MNVRRLRTLCVEIYKTLDDLNPSFLNLPYHIKSSDNLNTSQPQKSVKKLGWKLV